MEKRRFAIAWTPVNVFVFASYLAFTVIFLPSAVLRTATGGVVFWERSDLRSALAAINEVPLSTLLISAILWWGVFLVLPAILAFTFLLGRQTRRRFTCIAVSLMLPLVLCALSRVSPTSWLRESIEDVPDLFKYYREAFAGVVHSVEWWGENTLSAMTEAATLWFLLWLVVLVLQVRKGLTTRSARRTEARA